MVTTAGIEASQGVLMVGEFRRLVEGKVREDRDGNQRVPMLAKLLVRDTIQTVEYWDEESVPEIVRAAQSGDALTLPVYARAYKDRVYWRGVGERGDEFSD